MIGKEALDPPFLQVAAVWETVAPMMDVFAFYLVSRCRMCE